MPITKIVSVMTMIKVQYYPNHLMLNPFFFGGEGGYFCSSYRQMGIHTKFDG